MSVLTHLSCHHYSVVRLSAHSDDMTKVELVQASIKRVDNVQISDNTDITIVS